MKSGSNCRLFHYLIILFVVSCYFFGCNKKTSEGDITFSRKVGKNGGVINFLPGGFFSGSSASDTDFLVRLEFPPDALDSDVIVRLYNITYAYYSLTNSALRTYLKSDLVNEAFKTDSEYSIRPVSDFIGVEPRNTLLHKPVKITLKYTMTDDDLWELHRCIPSFRLFSYNTNSPNYRFFSTNRPYQVDTMHQTVSYSINNFSEIIGLGLPEYEKINKDTITIQIGSPLNPAIKYTTPLAGYYNYGRHLSRYYDTLSINLTYVNPTLYSSWTTNGFYYNINFAFTQTGNNVLSQDEFALNVSKYYRPDMYTGYYDDSLIVAYKDSIATITFTEFGQVGGRIRGSWNGLLVTTGANPQTTTFTGQFNFTRVR